MARSRKNADLSSGPPPIEFDPAAVEQLLGGRQTMAELDDLFRQMKKVLMEKALAGELTHHLGYAHGEPRPADQPNHRNGTTPKTVLSEDGAIPLAIPRDRAGTFEPRLVPKNARRLPKFDQNVLSLYARGMTVKEIREYLEELYQNGGLRPVRLHVQRIKLRVSEWRDTIIPGGKMGDAGTGWWVVAGVGAIAAIGEFILIRARPMHFKEGKELQFATIAATASMTVFAISKVAGIEQWWVYAVCAMILVAGLIYRAKPDATKDGESKTRPRESL